MKKIINIFIAVSLIISLFSSCASPMLANETYDRYSNDYSIVISNGTPFYINGMIAYYLYNNLYYYPYYMNGYHSFYKYDRPIPRSMFPRNYRPLPRNHNVLFQDNRNYYNRMKFENGNFNRKPNIRNGNNHNFGNMNRRQTFNFQRNGNIRHGNFGGRR